MRRKAIQTSGTGPPQLPSVQWRVRVRRALRWIKNRSPLGRPALSDWDTLRSADIGANLVVIDGERAKVNVESAGWLLAHFSHGEFAQPVNGLDLQIESWSAPWRGWTGRLGPLPGVVHHELRLPSSDSGPAMVSVTVREPLTVRRLLKAAMCTLDPWRPIPSPIGADIVTRGTPPNWLREDDTAPGVDARPAANDPLRPFDVAIASLEQSIDVTTLGLTPESVVIACASGVRGADGADIIVADATTANARGRERYGSDLTAAVLDFPEGPTGHMWRLCRERGNGPAVVEGRVGEPLTERQRSVIARIRVASVEDLKPDVPPSVCAAVMVQLAMTGVIVHSAAIEPSISALLTKELSDSVSARLPSEAAGPLEWELRSVTQRRAAMRGHAAGLTAGPGSVAYPSLAQPPTVSALLVTKRPGAIVDAIALMEAQTYPRLEIIVGLHGVDVEASVERKLIALQKPVHFVRIDEGLTFGEALAVTTDRASGTLVTKVDDDDKYGHEHMWDLVLARHFSGAAVVGKGAEFVYVSPYDTTVRRRMGSELFTDVVAGGTIMISSSDLEAVGGWRPLPRAVDRALLDRVLHAGGVIYRTHNLGFVYVRNASGHTWNPGVDYFLHDPSAQWRGLPPYPEFATP